MFIVTNRKRLPGSLTFSGKRRSDNKVSYLSIVEGGLVEGSALFKKSLFEATSNRSATIVIAIHGYNTSWEDSVRWFRVVDDFITSRLDGGITVGFSWPSDGDPVAYLSDRQEARDSAQSLAAAIMAGIGMIKRECQTEIVVVSYSMGNYLLAEATSTVSQLLGKPASYPVFSEIILVAADLDDNALEPGNVGSEIPVFARRVTVYHSAHYKALAASAAKRLGIQGGRLGRRGPANVGVLPQNVMAVDCSTLTVGEGNVHSSYFHVSGLLDDIVSTLRSVDRDHVSNRNKVGDRRYSLTKKDES